MALKLTGVTLSYPHLFTPRPVVNPRPGQKPRFQAMLLVPRDMDIMEPQQACYQLLKDKYGDATDQMIQNKQLKWPFRTDNLKQDGSPRFDPTKFKCFINVWSESQPGLVDRYQGPDGKPVKILQATQDKFYAGCVVNVTVNAFIFDQAGNRGAALGLNNMQFWADGERLDNRTAAEDDFAGDPRPEASLDQMGQSGAGTNGAAAPPAGQGSKGAPLANLFS